MDHLVLRHPSYMWGTIYPFSISVFRAKHGQSLNREENQCTIYIIKTLKKIKTLNGHSV
jgi:hypothetical protein